MMKKKLKNVQQHELENGAYLKVGKRWERILMVNLRDFQVRTEEGHLYTCDPDTEVKIKEMAK
jgi:hypothetical protein